MQHDKTLLSEAEVGRRAGVAPQTVRSARERGVIRPIACTPAGVRLYHPAAVAAVERTVSRRPMAANEPVAVDSGSGR